MLYFICSYITGVVKKNCNLYLMIGWTLIKLAFENCVLRKKEQHSCDWWKHFVGGFLECTSVSSGFTLFSFGCFRQVSKQTAAIEFKLEFNCLDWVNEYFIAILSVFPCNFMEEKQLFVLARSRALS